MHLSWVWVLLQKSSDDVKEALDQLRELGWAKRWSSQPYVSRRTVSALSSQASMIEHFVFAGRCIILSCVCSCNFHNATIM
jgi:hypothetical protein